MLGIELSTSQKVQIAFIAAILGTAAFLFFRNTRTMANDSVNAWGPVTRRYPVDKNKLVSPTNPIDPKKEGTVTVFACQDGRLEITEYRNDPQHRPTILWTYVDPRRSSYLYYHDPMDAVKAIKDGYPHAIALAAYNAANGKMLGLMANAALTPDQIAAEKKAREAMKDQLAVIDMGVDNGTFHQDILEKVMTALNAYRRAPGDPAGDKSQDLTKAQLVRDVLHATTIYLDKILADRTAVINKYIATMNDVLTADQKLKVAEKGRVYEASLVKKPAAPRPATPAPPRTPPRGTPTPARGTPAGRSTQG